MNSRRTPGMLTVVTACVAGATAVLAGSPAKGPEIAERVRKLTRDSPWKLVKKIPLAFTAYHPQGMVKIGDVLFVSSVEVRDRDRGSGTGHLFKIDLAGNLLRRITLGERAIYHPGGLDYDGENIWVPVAEYRPDSHSIIYRVDPGAMKATEVFRFADHIGAIAYNSDDRTLHGVSWGSRRFYRWAVERNGTIGDAGVPPGQLRTLNTSHYLDYQDCKYAGSGQMLCTGVTELRHKAGAPPFRLGGLDLVNLRDGRPVHQVPVLLWTETDIDMTHNPTWIEPTARGLRAYFMPEDGRSTIYVFEVETE